MELVSERTKAEIEQHEAAASLSWALRDLTSNLLRVTRGAGKAYCIPEQTIAVIKALQAYHAATGMGPSDSEMAEMLRSWRAPFREDLNEDEQDRRRAEDKIIRGTLQVVASRLIGQTTQEAAGDSEMYDGTRALKRAIDAANARYRAKQAEVEKAKRPVRKQVKKRTS